jgi:hypothetical protein
LIGWIADTQSNGTRARRHRHDKLFWAIRQGSPRTAIPRPGQHSAPDRNIGKIDNNGQYYSFVKTILKRSLVPSNRGGPEGPSQKAMPLEEFG